MINPLTPPTTPPAEEKSKLPIVRGSTVTLATLGMLLGTAIVFAAMDKDNLALRVLGLLPYGATPTATAPSE